jgi:hypothetical protein
MTMHTFAHSYSQIIRIVSLIKVTIIKLIASPFSPLIVHWNVNRACVGWKGQQDTNIDTGSGVNVRATALY